MTRRAILHSFGEAQARKVIMVTWGLTPACEAKLFMAIGLLLSWVQRSAAEQISSHDRFLNFHVQRPLAHPKWLEELASESNTIQAQEDIVCQGRLQAISR